MSNKLYFLLSILSVGFWLNLYGEWKRTGNVSEGITGFQNCVLTDGRVMIWGGTGSSGNRSTYEIFDPSTGRWTLYSAPRASTHSIGILLPNGKVLYTVEGSGQTYIYNPFTNTWTSGVNFGTWYERGLMTLLKDGKVLVMGFDNSNPTRCVLYDYVSNSIIPTTNSHYRHTCGIEVLLPSGEVLVAGGTSYITGSRKTEIYYPASGTWVVLGDMNVSRTQFVGVLLPPPWNKVLVACNYPSSSETELFDIATGVWTPAGNLNHAGRDTPTMVMLPCGYPLLIGGGVNSPSMIANAEIFNPNTLTWSLTDPMSSPRSHHGSAILHTGKALAISGYTDRGGVRTPTCDIYDPSDPYWEVRSPLQYGRCAHTATPLPIIHTSLCSTNILVAGGENSSGYLKSCELYNYDLNLVASTGSLLVGRAYHTAVLLPSGKVLVAGGKGVAGALNSCELYDANTESWSFTGNLHIARSNHTATLLKDGRVLVTGGESFSGNTGSFTSSCEVYDGSSWTLTASMAVPRAYHTAVLLLDGRVLVIGGMNFNGAINSCEIWNGTNWVPARSLSTARYLHTAVLLQSGKVLVIGGKGSAGNALSSCEIYDPTTGSWSAGPNLLHARYMHNSTLIYSGLVLVTGGYNGVNDITVSEIYDPAIIPPEWKRAGSLTTGRHCCTSTLIGSNKPYVITIGGKSRGNWINSIERHDVGLGYLSEWQSTITNYQSVTLVSDSMYIEGTLFRGVSEADGGNHCHIVSNDHPIISVVRIGGGNWQDNGGGTIMYIPWSSSWNESHTHVHLPPNPPAGYYRLWAIVNGIPCKWYERCIEVEERRELEVNGIECKVYPNPSTKSVVYFQINALNSQLLTLKIYDCAGRMLREIKTQPEAQTKIMLDGLTSGIYFYKIKHQDGEIIGKFVIIR